MIDGISDTSTHDASHDEQNITAATPSPDYDDAVPLTNGSSASPAHYIDPLSLVNGRLWWHAFAMLVVVVVLLPLGVGLARLRSPRHFAVQCSAIVVALIGVVLALSTGHALPEPHAMLARLAELQPRRKRHTHPAVVETGNADSSGGGYHAVLHTIGGLTLIAALLIQLLVGFGARAARRSDNYALARTLHRLFGYTLAFVLMPAQAVSGVAALFQLCDESLSGVDQCVGHFGPAAGMLLAALLYYNVDWRASGSAPHEPAASMTSSAVAVSHRYVMHGFEGGLLAVISTLSLLYSLYSEVPFTHLGAVHHVVIEVCFVALGSVQLAIVYRCHRAAKPLPRIITAGGPVATASLIACIMFSIHPQPTAYGTALHTVVGVFALFAGLFRLMRRFRFMALTLCATASLFVASQRGFQLLYTHVYASSFSITAAGFFALLAGLLLFGAAELWLHYFVDASAATQSALITDDIIDMASGDGGTVLMASDSLGERVASLVADDSPRVLNAKRREIVP